MGRREGEIAVELYRPSRDDAMRLARLLPNSSIATWLEKLKECLQPGSLRIDDHAIAIFTLYSLSIEHREWVRDLQLKGVGDA